MSKILLHICCGPCSIYPLSKLREEGWEVVGFFYNPNIYPEEEFLRRRDTLYEFSKRENCEVIYFDYTPEDFFLQIEPNLPATKRCPQCWALRISKTAQYAQENNFSLFTTTLLGSPYQNHEIIREIGEKIAQKYGVGFLYRDFRMGFWNAQNRAKELNLYRQNYCGCVYSKLEREERILQKKK